MSEKLILKADGRLVPNEGNTLTVGGIGVAHHGADLVSETFATERGVSSDAFELTDEHRARLEQLSAEGYSSSEAYELLISESSRHTQRVQDDRLRRAQLEKRRKLRAEQRRAMRAYWELLKGRSPDAITVQLIAGESGIAEGTLYGWRFSRFLKRRIARSTRFIF